MDQIIKAKELLNNVFGYEEFRELQDGVISNVLNKNDTLAIMPTGSGKSLCYQIPGLIFSGLTIVVSPLISLMKDQVEQLKELGVKAAYLNSSLSPDEYQLTLDRIGKKELKLIYLAPETLLKPNIQDFFKNIEVSSFTIDEAHCISAWGHDFRPEYRKLINIRNVFPKAVCIALTATATPRVQDDIMQCLGFNKANKFLSSFDRDNLFLQILPKENPVQQAIDFVKKFPDQSGIIYCLSRKQVDSLYQTLEGEGYSVKPYHAGLSDKERMKNQEQFIKDDVQIIVATVAFGMGINKPDVRFVLHYDLPQNIESYYQEIGRAGRDGLQSSCLTLFNYGDIHKIKYFINQKSEEEQLVAINHLNQLINYTEATDCRRISLLKYFGEKFSKENCDMCDNCLAPPKESVDITILAQKFLSCVKRTGERFGAMHIIDVLRGSKAKKVIEMNHNLLSTYNIGSDLSKKQWFSIYRQLLQKDLLIQELKFGSLMLTPGSYDVFKGIEKVSGTLIEDLEIREKKTVTSIEYDFELMATLKSKRKELADSNNVPPYVIFADKTLMEMAYYFPQSKDNLLKLYGVGLAKLEKFGDIFLGIIIRYCHENEIIEKTKDIYKEKKRANKTQTKILKNDKKLKYHLISEAYNDGKSVEEIVQENSIKTNTVINHFYQYLMDGKLIRQDGLLPLIKLTKDKQVEVMDYFKKLGTDFLKPIYAELKGAISYEDLSVLRVNYLAGQNSNTTTDEF
jgi:ATP-dependent DNA helicase RecQ